MVDHLYLHSQTLNEDIKLFLFSLFLELQYTVTCVQCTVPVAVKGQELML